MPALLTKMSSGPKISAVLVTAARSSSAEALSAFMASALPPPDSTSCTSFRALSFELEKVNATDAPSEASRRTMPAPIPFEPPVTRATLPVEAAFRKKTTLISLDKQARSSLWKASLGIIARHLLSRNFVPHSYVSLYNLAQQWLACSQALDVGCDSIGNVTE